MPYTRLLAAADIPAEKSHKFEHDGQTMLICHSGGAFFVIENRCSHAEQPLDCGRLRNG